MKPTTGWGTSTPSLYNPADAAVLLPNGSISPSSPGLGTSPNPILAGVPLYLNGIGIPGQNHVPKGLVNNNWNAFGPRIGFAYDVMGNGKTVVRGGFGIMYERIQGNDMYNAGPNIPFSLSVTNSSVTVENPSVLLATGSAGDKANQSRQHHGPGDRSTQQYNRRATNIAPVFSAS